MYLSHQLGRLATVCKAREDRGRSHDHAYSPPDIGTGDPVVALRTVKRDLRLGTSQLFPLSSLLSLPSERGTAEPTTHGIQMASRQTDQSKLYKRPVRGLLFRDRMCRLATMRQAKSRRVAKFRRLSGNSRCLTGALVKHIPAFRRTTRRTSSKRSTELIGRDCDPLRLALAPSIMNMFLVISRT